MGGGYPRPIEFRSLLTARPSTVFHMLDTLPTVIGATAVMPAHRICAFDAGARLR